MLEQALDLEKLLPLMEESFRQGKTVTFKPNGVSMLPMLRSGKDSVVLSALTDTPRKNDVILYRRTDGQFVLHRLLRITEEGFAFIGDAQYVTELVKKEQMIAVLIAFTRKGKTYQKNDVPYRLYVFFWNTTRPLRRFILRAVGWLKRRIKK